MILIRKSLSQTRCRSSQCVGRGRRNRHPWHRRDPALGHRPGWPCWIHRRAADSRNRAAHRARSKSQRRRPCRPRPDAPSHRHRLRRRRARGRGCSQSPPWRNPDNVRARCAQSAAVRDSDGVLCGGRRAFNPGARTARHPYRSADSTETRVAVKRWMCARPPGFSEHLLSGLASVPGGDYAAAARQGAAVSAERTASA